MKVVGEYEFGQVFASSIRKTDQSHRRISYKVVIHARTVYCCCKV